MSSSNGNEEHAASEMLLQATARAGIPEGDPLHAVLAAQAELLERAMSGLSPKAEQDHLAELTQAFEALAEKITTQNLASTQYDEKILRKLTLLISNQPARKLKRWVMWAAGGTLASIMAIMFLLGMKFEDGRVYQANDLARKAVTLATDKIDSITKKAPSNSLLVKPLPTP